MEFLQSESEMQQAFDEVTETIKPAVLRDCVENHKLILTWLQKNRLVNGKIDVSVTNLQSCYDALGKAGLLDWEVEPERPVEVKRDLTPTNIPFINNIRSKLNIQDMDHNVYKKWLLGPHAAAFKLRISEIQAGLGDLTETE